MNLVEELSNDVDRLVEDIEATNNTLNLIANSVPLCKQNNSDLQQQQNLQQQVIHLNLNNNSSHLEKKTLHLDLNDSDQIIRLNLQQEEEDMSALSLEPKPVPMRVEARKRFMETSLEKKSLSMTMSTVTVTTASSTEVEVTPTKSINSALSTSMNALEEKFQKLKGLSNSTNTLEQEMKSPRMYGHYQNNQQQQQQNASASELSDALTRTTKIETRSNGNFYNNLSDGGVPVVTEIKIRQAPGDLKTPPPSRSSSNIGIDEVDSSAYMPAYRSSPLLGSPGRSWGISSSLFGRSPAKKWGQSPTRNSDRYPGRYGDESTDRHSGHSPARPADPDRNLATPEIFLDEPSSPEQNNTGALSVPAPELLVPSEMDKKNRTKYDFHNKIAHPATKGKKSKEKPEKGEKVKKESHKKEAFFDCFVFMSDCLTCYGQRD